MNRVRVEAQLSGHEAAARGEPVSVCPYPYGSEQGRSWVRGWVRHRDVIERANGGFDARHEQARVVLSAEARLPAREAFDRLMAEVDAATCRARVVVGFDLGVDTGTHYHTEWPSCRSENA